MKRISVGGAFFYVGVGARGRRPARELLEQGTYGFWSTGRRRGGHRAGAAFKR